MHLAIVTIEAMPGYGYGYITITTKMWASHAYYVISFVIATARGIG